MTLSNSWIKSPAREVQNYFGSVCRLYAAAWGDKAAQTNVARKRWCQTKGNKSKKPSFLSPCKVGLSENLLPGSSFPKADKIFTVDTKKTFLIKSVVGAIFIWLPEWRCGAKERKFKAPTNWLRGGAQRSRIVFDRRRILCLLIGTSQWGWARITDRRDWTVRQQVWLPALPETKMSVTPPDIWPTLQLHLNSFQMSSGLARAEKTTWSSAWKRPRR